MFSGEDEGKHLPEGVFGAFDAELVVTDEKGDGLSHITQIGTGKQLGDSSQSPLHCLDESTPSLSNHCVSEL